MSKDSKNISAKVGKFWSKRTADSHTVAGSLKVRWWQSPFIVRHINTNVCGEEVSGFSQGLIQKVKTQFPSHLPLRRGISVGCGVGNKEMNLLKENVVGEFDLFELSESRIEQGKALAKTLDLTDRVHFHHADAFTSCTEPETYDCVFWNNSLHHMFDVEAAMEWSHSILTADGLLIMDDFVGPNRFQWTEKSLSIASRVRAALGNKYLVDPRFPEKHLPTKIKRPSKRALIADDPSEAVQSELILPSLRKRLPKAEIVCTGGIVYHLALNDVLHNINEENDAALLRLLMIIDDLSTQLGETHYAIAVAPK